MNANLLRGKMTEKGYSQKTLAAEIGMATNSLNRKLLGKREFTLAEVVNICNALNISNVQEIFFEN